MSMIRSNEVADNAWNDAIEAAAREVDKGAANVFAMGTEDKEWAAKYIEGIAGRVRALKRSTSGDVQPPGDPRSYSDR